MKSISYKTDFSSAESVSDTGTRRLFGSADISWHQWFADMTSTPSAELAGDIDAYPKIKQYHWREPRRIDARSLVVRDAMIVGLGFVSKGHDVIAPASCYPSYFAAKFHPDLISIHPWTKVLSQADLSLRKADYPLAVACHPNLVYGHFLLEILPRMYTIRNMIDTGVAIKVAWSSSTPLWVHALVKTIFSSEEIYWYDHTKEYILAPYIISPSMLNDDYSYHPFLNLASECLKQRSGLLSKHEERYKKVFLSRKKHPTPRQGIKNFEQVENALMQLGFTILHPEDHSLSEQLSIYSNIDILVSDYNSSLHNTLFMPFGCKVIVLNWFNWYQHSLCALREQPLTFLEPADGGFRFWHEGNSERAFYNVDTKKLSREISVYQ